MLVAIHYLLLPHVCPYGPSYKKRQGKCPLENPTALLGQINEVSARNA